MRKAQQQKAAAAGAQSSESIQVTRGLYKVISDISRKLDDLKSHALAPCDIFTPYGSILRAKLKDYCEKLIFKDLVGHARKTEELLWRKALYDAVSTAKKLRKESTWSEKEKAWLLGHLDFGAGFYQHLILKLQLEFNLDLTGTIDFAFVDVKASSAAVKSKSSKATQHTEETKECALYLVHRCLICLGDLSRYALEVDPNWDSTIASRYYKMAIVINSKIGMPHNQLGTMSGNKNYGLDAVYHYMRCITCPEPFDGAEGNLRRTIANYSSVVKERTHRSLAQRCVAELLSLLHLWDNNEPHNIDRINELCKELLCDMEACLTKEKSDSHLSSVCSIAEESSIDGYLQNCRNELVAVLSESMIFQKVAICLMLIAKLQAKESNESHSVIAFVLAVFSQLIQFSNRNLQEAYHKLPTLADDETTTLSLVDCNDNKRVNGNCDGDNANCETNGNAIINGKKREKKSLLTKLRRRRTRQSNSDSETSDLEENEAGENSSESEEANSDISETEEDGLLSDGNLSEEEGLLSGDESTNNIVNLKKSRENNNLEEKEEPTKDSNKEDLPSEANGTTDNGPKKLQDSMALIKKKQRSNASDVFEAISGEYLLATIKICCDWLRNNQAIIKMCAKTSRILLKHLTTLLNLINLNTEELLAQWNAAASDDSTFLTGTDKIVVYTQTVPLPEDVELKDLKFFEQAQKNLDWNFLRKQKMSKREEILLRVAKLVNFGHFLSAIPECKIKYHFNKKLFVIQDVEKSSNNNNAAKNEKNLDRKRGKLMRHMGKLWLKAEVKALESKLHTNLMSPYLVPDHEALAKHMPALKRLVYAKKFIVIVPSVVVSQLDELKRTSGRAREATRWLETQLRKGSRFLRAQRTNEKLPLPFIKGPKSKDKEAWMFFEIIECCYYLTQQNKVADGDAPVVTLLTGCNFDEKKPSSYSPEGLAKNAGVNLEHIESFHTKWKTSSKSHG